MQPYELKKYICEDYNRLELILKEINMHHVKSHVNYYSCGMPDGDNIDSTIIRKKSLNIKAYTRDVEGDIFSLIMFIKSQSFGQANKYIHNILKLKYTFYGETFNKIDLLKRFRKISHKNNNIYSYNTHPEYILYRYEDYPHIDFIHDNILPKTMKKFDVRWDDYSKRIIIPHRLWNTDEIVGIFGRTTIKDWEEKRIKKYIGVLPYSKGGNLYGLSVNYQDIKKAKSVIVFESEKSVMQCDSFNINNTVAICCQDITPEQKRILLSLDVDIILAFDKGVKKEHIEKQCNLFKGSRNVYYLKDTEDLLSGKDSPSDNGYIVFEILLDNKIKYKGENSE